MACRLLIVRGLVVGMGFVHHCLQASAEQELNLISLTVSSEHLRSLFNTYFRFQKFLQKNVKLQFLIKFNLN